jgi:hypothetical protein
MHHLHILRRISVRSCHKGAWENHDTWSGHLLFGCRTNTNYVSQLAHMPEQHFHSTYLTRRNSPRLVYYH